MKIVSIIGLVFAVIGISAGLYCQIEYMPKVDQQEIFGRDLYYAYMETKFNLGSIALFAGILGVVIGLIGGIKKQMLGWIAVGVGLISFILGALQSTHMFD